MPTGRSQPRTRFAVSLLCVLVCASCLSGASGRSLYRRVPDLPPEPTSMRATAPAMPKATPIETSVPVPPLSLTSADGTALMLERMDVRGVIDGPLALTELHLDFHHAESRTIEGRFEINLPPGAELSRFAMRVGASWQEAEVVERQRARVVYEAILHQGLDPALLEQDAGNRFSARVFPIGPYETKHLIVAYTQQLDAGADAYRIPLRGLPKLAELNVEIGSAQAQTSFRQVHTRYLAKQDLVVPLPPMKEREQAFAAGELAVVRVVPVPADAALDANEAIDSVTLLVDTSASRAANFMAKLERLEAFCQSLRAQLSGDAQLVLVAFDQVSEEIYRGPLSGLSGRHFERIVERRPLGATDLPGALARLREGESQRLLLATDGVLTVGEATDAAALTAAIAAKGFERVDVLVDGSVREQALLERLVGEGLRFAGQVVELEREQPSAAVARVRRPSLEAVEFEVEGASWFAPHERRGLQPGEDVLVFARFDKPPRSLHVTTHEHAHEARTRRLNPMSIDRPLLERTLVAHQVRNLVTELQARAAEDREWAALTIREIVELSTRHRVLTPYTAMLVLENDAAYARFDLEREELAPILTVDGHGVKLESRRGAPTSTSRDIPEALLDPEQPQPPERPRPREREKADEPTYRAMQQLERETSELLELERKQEEEQRKRLLELERQAAAAGSPDPHEFQDDDVDGELLAPEGANLSEPEPDIDALLDPSRVRRSNRSDTSPPADEDMPLASPADEDFYDHENPLEAASADLRREASPHRAKQPPRRMRPVKPPKPPKPSKLTARRTRTSAGLELDGNRLDAIDATVRRCYDQSLHVDGKWSGRAELHVEIDEVGRVSSLRIDGASGHPQFDGCLRSEASQWRFRPRAGWLQRRFVFEAGAPNPASWSQRPNLAMPVDAQPVADAPVEGRYAELLEMLASDQVERALEFAVIWHELFPGDPLALMGLGQSLAAAGRIDDAARAYGGILDLHPSRADIRRFAGNLLESLPQPSREGPASAGERGLSNQLALALDSYRRAVELRPDQPSSYRMLAMAQARGGELEAAFDTLERALELNLPSDRYAGVRALLFADLQLIAGAWAAREPKAHAAVLRRVMAAGGSIDEQPSLRFVLSWETDANDVDLHVRDGLGHHAYYQHPGLPAGGGHLIADVTTGFGPEGFVIAYPSVFPYALSVDYYSRNSAGHGMGQVQIVRHDGAGTLRFENRPFVVMTEHREFQLGTVGESIAE